MSKLPRSTEKRRAHVPTLTCGRLEPPSSVVGIILSFADPSSFMEWHSVVGVNRTWLAASQSLTVMHIDPPPGSARRKQTRRATNDTEKQCFNWKTMLRALRKFPNARDVHLGLLELPSRKRLPKLCGDVATRALLARLVSVELEEKAYRSIAVVLRHAPRVSALRLHGCPFRVSAIGEFCALVANRGLAAGIARPNDSRHCLNPSATDRRIISVNGKLPVLCHRSGYQFMNRRCEASGCSQMWCPHCSRMHAPLYEHNPLCWGCTNGLPGQTCEPR